MISVFPGCLANHDRAHSQIQNQCTRRRKAVCPVPRLLEDDVVPNFHITPFLPLNRCDLVYFNPMDYGTQNATKSVYHPVVHLRTRRLRLTRLQVITEKVNLKSITGTLPRRPNQIRRHPQKMENFFFSTFNGTERDAPTEYRPAWPLKYPCCSLAIGLEQTSWPTS